MAVTTLVDAEERQSQFPKSFELPSEESRMSLSISDFVQLIFSNGRGHAERMWVQVFAVFGDGSYAGRLDNTPFLDHSTLVFNASVVFEARHVIQIRQRETTELTPGHSGETHAGSQD